MKNSEKLKAMRSIAGIIALAVVIGLSMTGCEQPDDTPTVTLTGITADYTGGSVAINTDVNSLKSNLTVTAKYSDNTGKTLNAEDYSLSGDLSSSGQKTVTVTYAEDGITKTDTFNVTVTAAPTADITYTITQTGGANKTDDSNGADTTGIVFTFSASVTGLTADHISVTSGNGSVTKGALSGSGTSWTLGVTVTTPGNVTVSIIKTGIEAETKNVTVYKTGQTAPALTGITLNSSAVKNNYTQNDTFDLTGLVVTANYSDSTSATVIGYISNPADGATLSSTGQITVTVSYTEGEVTKTASFIVNVTAATTTKTLTDITLNSSAVEKDYTQNETLDLTGLIVTANYSDSTSAPVTDFTSNPADGAVLSSTGQITVTVSYTEGTVTKTASFIVNVNAAPIADITYTAEQTGGTDGSANTTGIAFTFSASVTGLTADHISVAGGNGSLTKGALSGSGTSWTLGVTVITPGNVTVAIDKSGIEAEPKDVIVFMEEQAAPTLDSISADYTQGSTIIYPNTPLNDLKAGLTVTATYNIGAPQQVTAYELSISGSGTLTVGTSTVTVTFEGKTTTFTVDVTAATTNYTVTFNSNGGNSVTAQTIASGGKATEPQNVTRNGYTLAGWFRDNTTFQNQWNFATDTVTQNIILYAKWNINLYTVTFNSLGGSSVQAQTVEYGSKAAEPQNVTLSGFTFVGWYKGTNQWNFATDTVTNDMTLYAKWNVNQYTVTFNSNGGSTVANIPNVTHGTYITEPSPNPTKANYAFGGWYKEAGLTNAWNFATDTVTQDITLYAKWNQKADITVVAIPAQTYNGNAHEPTVTVKDGATTLTIDTDYSVTYANNTNAGTATVTVTGKGNYAGITGSGTFTINKANPTVTWPTGLTADYGQTLSAVSLPGNGTSTPAGTFSWTTPTYSVGNVGTQSHNLTFTPTDTANYNSASGSITVNVAKATGSFGTPAAVNTTYTSGLTLGSITLTTGYAWNAPNTTLNAGNNQSFAATFTDPSGNYNSASGSITVNVAKATGAAVNAPIRTSSITTTSITTNVYDVTAPANGQTVEYARNSTNTAPSTGWQDSTTFNGLTSGTTYYIFARSKENTNYNAGTASASLTVTTGKPIEMVEVPGGNFQMGKELNPSSGYSDVTPVHTVALTRFYMSKTEVTQAQYEAVMELPSQVTAGDNTAYGRGVNYPVYYVSWYDALVFCNKLSMAEGLTPAYRINNSTNPASWGSVPTSNNSTWNAVEVVSGSTGYRLPTEAQWEYAAKGGNGTPGNYTYSGSNNADDVAWYEGNSHFGTSTKPVGTKAPNSLGLYDMSGNVTEWCWDRSGNYPSDAQTNPTGDSSGSYRMIRGGSWYNLMSVDYARSAYRSFDSPYKRDYYYGFRLVRPAQ